LPLSKEKLPNNPLTGPELKEFVLALLRERMENDWLFTSNTTYPRVAGEIVCKFHFSNINLKDAEVRVRLPHIPEAGIEGAPPLKDPEPEQTVTAFSREFEVQSPNLVRVAHGLPITVMKKEPAKPGEIINRMVPESVTYDPAQYEKPTPPVDKDLTVETAKEFGIKVEPPPPLDRELNIQGPAEAESPSQKPKRVRALGYEK